MAISRATLEGAALEAYRKRIIGESRLQQWLGFETRFEVHAFLKEHGVPFNYSLEDLEHDRQAHDRLGIMLVVADTTPISQRPPAKRRGLNRSKR